eukprot:gene1099-535_t
MVRKLKHHEQKLLKKVNFHNWKSTDNVRENAILRKYFIQDRTDYSKYQELCRRVQKTVHLLRNMPADDEDRIKMTEILLKKLFTMGVASTEQSLETVEKIPASAFCRRRLAVMVVRLRFCQHLQEAVTYIEQGHFRIGPDVVNNPAMHVTRDMEDHIHWTEGSAIKRTIKEFNDELDDFELLGN